MDSISAELLSLPWSPKVILNLAGHLGCCPMEHIYTDHPPSDWGVFPYPTPRQLLLHRVCVEKVYFTVMDTFNTVAAEYGFSVPLLLHMLRVSSSIISGSFALCVLHPDMITPGDIDIYSRFANNHLMEEFLVIHGYEKDANAHDLYPGYPLHAVLKFVRNTSTGKKTVNLIYTVRSPISAITQFHSTLVMNYIAWYGLVCLYPQLTFRKEGIAFQVCAEDCYRKYSARGFSLTPVTLSVGLNPGPRSLHSPDTWFLPFSTVRSSDRHDLAYLEKENITWNNVPDFYRRKWETVGFNLDGLTFNFDLI